jgi:hypothetical protein
MEIEEQTILNYYYYKNLFQVLIESDLKLALIHGSSLRKQFDDSQDMMPEHYQHDIMEYYDVLIGFLFH